MARTKLKQIADFRGVIRRRTAALSIVTGTNAYNVTSAMAGAASGGTATQAGVITAAPKNRVLLMNNDTGREIAQADGDKIFGRITFATAVFTLTLYVSDGAGGETAYAPVAGDSLNGVEVDIFYGEIVHAKDHDPTDIVNGLFSADELPSSDPNSHVSERELLTVATNGQTAFTLSFTPKAESLRLEVNGQAQVHGVDFTNSGTAVTWTDNDFTLETSDEVVAQYDR
jgi:hypothetical protein